MGRPIKKEWTETSQFKQKVRLIEQKQVWQYRVSNANASQLLTL